METIQAREFSRFTKYSLSRFTMIKAIKALVRGIGWVVVVLTSVIVCAVILVVIIIPMIIAEWFDRVQEWANGESGNN